VLILGPFLENEIGDLAGTITDSHRKQILLFSEGRRLLKKGKSLGFLNRLEHLAEDKKRRSPRYRAERQGGGNYAVTYKLG